MNTPKLLQEEAETEQANKKMSQRSPGVQRYLVAVEYIGTNFVGFQKQPNGRTVQGMLEDAFSKFIGQPVSSACSSRTDAGVHALANVCHVDVERISKRKPGEVLPPHKPGVVKSAVNHFLQKNAGDMSVVDVQCVPITFHARFKAQERTYYYRILSGIEPLSTFEKDRAWHVPEDLNVSLMKEACKVLIGHHDFSSFRASGCQAKSPIKSLTQLDVFEIPAWPAFPSSTERVCRVDTPDRKDAHLSFERKDNIDKPVQNVGDISLSCEHPVERKIPVLCPEDHEDYNEGEVIEFGCRRGHHGYVVTARAPSFLYHQVRLLVGALKCVGTGKLSVEDVERILKARSIMVAPPMAPAHGLYLAKVKYDFSSNKVNQIEDDGLSVLGAPICNPPLT
ncbi:uncharacterized protein LOC131027806 isoform X1 [Cryptomeria japonica]|uniref:uncharacterized protein LOC131027806 isoform X1 n=1 Tax=Cryptomeria japonica TaxID=3369 RepID=UPI0027DA1E50|nr:uncharacterized protein LOC131027806 isoform X1 [Cryptomeria japonica]